MRWGHWTHFEAEGALKHVREKVFPWFKEMGGEVELTSTAGHGASFRIRFDRPDDKEKPDA